MSVHSLASDDKIIPASASIEVGSVTMDDNPRRASLLSCLFEVLTPTLKSDNYEKVQLEMDKAHPKRDHPHPQPEKPDVPDSAVGKYPCDQAQHYAEATESSNATAKEADKARNNWLELRARVESVDPRVFAYQKDPKYLQQCEEAKQRRALAAATSVSPSWH